MLTGSRRTRAKPATLSPTTMPPHFILQVVSNFVDFFKHLQEKGGEGRGKERKGNRPQTLPPSPPPFPFPLSLSVGGAGNFFRLFYIYFFLVEMEELPYGTGSLYVQDEQNAHLLKKETRALNSTERAEAVAIQFLLLGGHTRYTGFKQKPIRVFSSIHTGPGQLVFGYSEKQRADLMLAFQREDIESSKNKSKMELHFFNYHGFHWHYDGHMEECPSTEDRFTSMFVHQDSLLKDNFRYAYASAMSRVFKQNVTFHYHVIYECELVHGIPVPSILQPGKTFFSAQELLAEEMPEDFYLPPPSTKKLYNKETLIEDIASGKVDGFVTLRGGREARQEPPVCNNFGFCVQNYAPQPSELSQHTKKQIASYYGLKTDEEIDNFLLKQAPRTLNSTTFHSEETISTNYLRWLMQERDFVDFEITHFLWYKFGHQSRRFIEPLLQLRHEMKKEGNLPAAEVLKLILNGAYG